MPIPNIVILSTPFCQLEGLLNDRVHDVLDPEVQCMTQLVEKHGWLCNYNDKEIDNG